MKVAIAGAGNVGRFLTDDLARGGHEVVLIDRDPDRLASMPPTEGVSYITADACEVSALQAAHFDEMDVVVAVTGDDEDNLVVSQLSKQEFAVPRVIARVNHPKNHWLFNEMWGVDVAVSTPHLLAGLVEEAVSVGTLVRLLQFEGGHTRLMEVTLDADSPVLGREFGSLVLPAAPPSWPSFATATWSCRARTRLWSSGTRSCCSSARSARTTRSGRFSSKTRDRPHRPRPHRGGA